MSTVVAAPTDVRRSDAGVPVLAYRHVVKRFGGLTVLSGVSMDVRRARTAAKFYDSPKQDKIVNRVSN